MSLFALLAVTGGAQHPAVSAGMAWRVQGEWTTKGLDHPLQPGDPLSPGSLAQPAGLDNAHSLTVLLPDGQQLLFECFTPEDCARGFRIPALVDRPSHFASEMLARIRAVVKASAPTTPPAVSSTVHKRPPALDEAVVVWSGAGAVPVAGLLASLPDGRYTYTLQQIQQAAPHPDVQVMQKSGGTFLLPVPSPGLYDIVITDAQGVRRVDMFVAALDAKHQSVMANYGRAKKLLDEWNERFTGWPRHELLRAYLQSLLSDTR